MLTRRLHGLGRVVWSTVDRLARLAPQDEFVLIGDSPWAQELSRATANVRVVPLASKPFSLSEQWRLPAAMLRSEAQLFHAPSAALPFVRPLPYVLTIPDLIPLLFYGQRLRYRMYFRYWLPWAARRARRVLVFSEAARDDLVRHLRLSASHISVVPLGVSDSFHPRGTADEMERLTVRYGIVSPYLLTAGNPKPYKNVHRAIELFDAVLQTLDESMHGVVLSGLGPLSERALSHVATRARLHRLDYVEEEDLPALYRHAHLFFYPSRYEGFGLQVLEAMACGCVVISSGAASLREVVGDGGLLVDVSHTGETLQALSAASSDENMRRKLRSQAIARAADFTWGATAERTLEVYRNAL